MTLRILPRAYTHIVSHVENSYPEEGAGFLLGCIEGDLRIVEVVLPQENTFGTTQRHRRYMIGPSDMLQAERFAEERGFEILGIFHSHPDHPAEPSSFDLEWSLPWFSYLITSVNEGKADSTRSWRLNEDRTSFIEEEIDWIQENQNELEEFKQ
jgi:proteasome lid subunit RPN8/RPN11